MRLGSRPIVITFVAVVTGTAVVAIADHACAATTGWEGLDLGPHSVGFHLLVSWGMSEEAISVFRLNAELHSESVHAHESLGRAYVLSGDATAAIASFRRVLELDPDNERARVSLEQLLATEDGEPD